jgi:hypothetical protein
MKLFTCLSSDIVLVHLKKILYTALCVLQLAIVISFVIQLSMCLRVWYFNVVDMSLFISGGLLQEGLKMFFCAVISWLSVKEFVDSQWYIQTCQQPQYQRNYFHYVQLIFLGVHMFQLYALCELQPSLYFMDNQMFQLHALCEL